MSSRFVSQSASTRSPKKKQRIELSATKVIVTFGCLFFLVNIFVLSKLEISPTNSSDEKLNLPSLQRQRTEKQPSLLTSEVEAVSQCQYREYPPHRYYGLDEKIQPSFLTAAEYIFGEAPMVLQPSTAIMDRHQGKFCVNQSEWLSEQKTERLPFADGTNPSILSVERMRSTHPDLVTELEAINAAFVATICMSDSQCSYKDSDVERDQYKLSLQEKPSTLRTVFLVLDINFNTLLESTILLQRDAQWGKRYKAVTKGDGFALQAFTLDDARLFISKGALWISYREGKSFGYDKQVLNEVHLEYDNKQRKISAFLKASETATLCCGRNMALMQNVENPQLLESLTWVDPVTVVEVDIERSRNSESKARRLGEAKKNEKKSEYHGTNAFMVYLKDSDEFLGIGHFHRPSGRQPFNQYARFGHHYTHSFFTITAREPYRLSRLSREFVFPSQSDLHETDAEIIQFMSGLEVLTIKGKEMVVVAYGINDCEGGAVYLDMTTVQSMLQAVEEGKEVVDLMSPLS